MQLLFDLLKITLPALFVILTVWLMLRGFLGSMSQALRNMEQAIVGQFNQQSEQRRQDLKLKQQESLLPLRLQAYERMTLFCSRIELTQLMMRHLDDSMSARQFRFLLTASIEEEFNHNITQQVYMGEELWKMLQIAKAEAIKILEQVSKVMPAEASARDYINAVAAYLEEEPQMGYIQAQVGIKKEVQGLF